MAKTSTASVLMDHASSARALDLYAGFVPNTGLSAGTGHLTLLEARRRPFRWIIRQSSSKKGGRKVIIPYIAGVAKW